MMVVMRMMIMLMIPVSGSVALLRSFVKYLWSVATSSFLVVSLVKTRNLKRPKLQSLSPKLSNRLVAVSVDVNLNTIP